MAHFCGFIKLIFLLLMLERMLESSETRPLKGSTAAATSSDLIAGNEFLKLFMDREELETEFYNKQQHEGGGGGGSNGGVASGVAVTEDFKDSEEFDKKSAETGRVRRLQNARSLKVKAAKVNQAGDGDRSIDLKQVGKFQGPVSKVVYMDDDYEENDAILDAEVRDIDLQRERYKDEYKVVDPSSSAAAAPAAAAVSSPTASQRGVKNRVTTTTSKYDNKSYTSTKSIVTMTPRPPVATTTKKPSPSPSSSSSSSLTSKSTKTDTAATATGDNFINRSHKSEHSIEEVEPSAAKQPQQQQQRQQYRKPQQHKSRKSYTRHRTTYPITSVADTLEALDSENSESTNIQNVLASPLQPAASLRSMSAVTTTYHSGQRNVSINHDTAAKVHKSNEENDTNLEQTAATGGGGGGVDDQLLPFQTVIYHDTKDGHGPQSRSISYSSISQNVEDLKKWHQSGILAEARRNVSESLKLPHSHQSEPSKFYSQPSKMYSEPSKFYSEPAKVYSEPAKVYGEPEKFYSEPAKNYGQPAKFYSEPSKIYSQPSKVYSEPAKTYWPVPLTTTSSTTGRPVTFNPTTNQPQVTTTSPNAYHGSRKPAIVSRIAFGEAAGTTTSSSTTTSTTPSPTTTSTTATTTTTTKPFSSYHHRTYGHRQTSTGTSTAFSSPSSERINENTSSATPSRRILFNLDRLPYDLLNAPQPATQQQQQQHHHLLEPQKPQRSQQQQHALTYQQQQQSIQPLPPQQQRHHNNINPCLESAVSSLFSSSTLSAHPALIKQRQQHSSLSDQQHSNQNAKGLPNGDLVRCVAEIAHTATTSPNDGIAADDVGLQYTTEHSSNIEELFTPTPEQNYEIEESVSVMTNGRAHGVQGGGRNSLQLATTTPVPPPLAPQVFKPNRQRVHFGTNLNGGAEAVAGGGGHLSQTSYSNNANANRGLHGGVGGGIIAGDGNTSPDYNSYDDGDNDDSNNDEYADDDTARHRGGSGAANGGEDDSKVAYVVEGRNYRKYRVEEKTDDGFIVGEYGVVDHNDGNLRGVRYTADSTINRSLIQKALLTFLKLK